ncbi:ferric uptake regulator, Fur family protein [Paenibacillus vortex V453]|uniref:Ferric uptake regulator, Fur family protein n=1 Tax=Paenibacillus vortex V453 TaxID=715225 RepID=A0A2R9T1R1_9BACL|nr:ferric uptake regulator, Fur family protein [Paenibacillus vortex V453]
MSFGKSHDHPTAADIMNRLVEKGYNLAYGTVYNSLRYLTDKQRDPRVEAWGERKPIRCPYRRTPAHYL